QDVIAVAAVDDVFFCYGVDGAQFDGVIACTSVYVQLHIQCSHCDGVVAIASVDGYGGISSCRGVINCNNQGVVAFAGAQTGGFGGCIQYGGQGDVIFSIA